MDGETIEPSMNMWLVETQLSIFGYFYYCCVDALDIIFILIASLLDLRPFKRS